MPYSRDIKGILHNSVIGTHTDNMQQISTTKEFWRCDMKKKIEGSLVNRIMEKQSIEPVVGMGVTECCYTDRHPYTITKVISPCRIEVVPDNYKVVSGSCQDESAEYEYSPGDPSRSMTLRKNNDGRWKETGYPDGDTFVIGRREEYYDPSF
jgi:hypothetical protein